MVGNTLVGQFVSVETWWIEYIRGTQYNMVLGWLTLHYMLLVWWCVFKM